MCLDSIRREIKNPSQKQYAAWKVFEVWEPGDKILHFPYKSLNGDSRVPYGKWLKANPVSVSPDWGASFRYTSGFHVFRTRADAESWMGWTGSFWTKGLRRVAIRGVSYVGLQNGCTTLVAQEMYVKPDGV